MPGRSIPIPSECIDARGKTLPQFNPAVRIGPRVVGRPDLDLPPNVLRGVLRAAGSTGGSLREVWQRAIAIWIAAAVLWGGGLPVISLFATFHLQWWKLGVMGMSLALIPAAAIGAIGLGASLGWGVVAFTGAAAPVVRAWLAAGRCPSCAYPLAVATHGEGSTVTCSECGAVWAIAPHNPNAGPSAALPA